MKISEYIVHLQKLLAEHGDLEIYTDSRYVRAEVKVPKVAFVRILTKRESSPQFWYSFDPPERKGEKVIRI